MGWLLERMQDVLTRVLLRQGVWMLRHGRAKTALAIATRALHTYGRLDPDSGETVPRQEDDYADALLLKARALAHVHSPNAVGAYLRARQWTSLQPEDIDFLGGYYLNHVPKTFSAFPIYLDWYKQAEDPDDAEQRIRRVAEIRQNELPDEPTLPVRQELNEYLAAHFPTWHWTLEHLANCHLVYEDLDAAHACLAEWYAREPDNREVRSRERLTAGQRHLAANQLPEAIGAFETSMAAHGSAAEAAARELLSVVRRARLSKAQVRHIRRAFDGFSLRTDDVGLLVDYATWVAQSDDEAALATLHRAVDIDPQHPTALWELSIALYRRGHPQHALEHLDRFLRIRPDDLRATVWASRIAEEVGDWESAIAFLDRVPTRNAQQDLRYARALISLKRTEAARDLLTALDLNALPAEQRAVAERLLADVLYESGDLDGAAERYEILLDTSDDWTLYYRLGVAFLARQRWEDARDALSEAILRNPGHVPSLNARGSASFHLGDRKGASEDFHEALLHDLHQPKTLYALALCLIDDDVDLAATFLRHAVEYAPDMAGAWLALARIAEEGEDWAEATRAYRKAMENSDDPAIHARLAFVALRSGDHSAATEYFEQRADADDADAFARYALGMCSLQAGDLVRAAQQWRASLLVRDDPKLREDLAWLHIRLADAAAARNRAEMTQHWNTAIDRHPESPIVEALVQRWTAEAVRRLRYPESFHPSSRDFQIAYDLMSDVLHYTEGDPVYRLIAGLCAARMGDWQLADDLVEPLTNEGLWATEAAYFAAVCRMERNLPDSTLAILETLGRDWGPWEPYAQAFRVQVFLSSSDIDKTARELAMLRAMAPEHCTQETTLAVLLHLRVWRQLYDFVQELPSEDRSPLAFYAHGVAALMLRRETEGIERLEQVPAGSEWDSAAQSLRLTGYKRQALRAFQALGWSEVARSLEAVVQMDEDDETVRDWLERAKVFALLSSQDPGSSATLVAKWRERIRREPTDPRPLHQWATFAYWDAQTEPTPEKWRHAMSLWGTLLNLEGYWRRWIADRLKRHDPKSWIVANEDETFWTRVAAIVAAHRTRMMESLTSEMTDSVLRANPASEELDALVLDFLREYRTSMLWREWLDENSDLRDAVLPYGGDLLETLHRLDEARDILSTTLNLEPTSLTERLLIYLSPLGSLIAAAETGNERFAHQRARGLFTSPDATERRYARIVYVLATRHGDWLTAAPREGLETALTAVVAAHEVGHSSVIAEVAWGPIFARLSDAIVAEVEGLANQNTEERIRIAADMRDLLRRAYETTRMGSLIHAIVRLTILEVRARVVLGRRGRRAADDPYFSEQDAEALGLLQEALALAPDHVTLQQEAAQLRLRRGLVAASEDRLNEALIDFSRAHELDPVSHRITTTYATFMMEQAARVWMETRADAQREALSLAHRVLSADPTDPQLLARCARFLDLPEAHPLRETPEYRRLAALFLRQEGNHES